MIDTRMANQQIIDFENLPRSQIRRDDAFTGIEVPHRCAAGIDHQNFTAGQFDHRGIALTDVQVGNAQSIGLLPLGAPIVDIASEQNRKYPNRECNMASLAQKE